MEGKICVNCVNPIKDLYKTYSSNVIKIRECEKCQEIADKYVEFEQITVVIDLALLQTPAYRHVLFNTDFQKFWKYSIILIFIEGYLLWNNVFTGTEDPEFYNADEKGFYVSCLTVLTEHLLFFTLIYGFMRLFGNCCCSVRLLWKAMTLSHFSKLLFVPIMIWRGSSMWELGINYLLISGYSIMSLICSLSVVAQTSRLRTTLIILASMFIRRLCMDQVEPLISTIYNH